MLLQRVTRKSLYRFRTSFGGSSSAGGLWQQFAMRIRLIPIRRNQNTEKEKPTLRIILNTHLTLNIVLPTTTIPTLHATPTHTTLTYSTLPHCITSHTLLPLSHRYMLHQHAYTNTCYTFTLHSPHHLELITQHVIFYYAQKTYIQDLYATPPPAPLLNIQYPTIKRRNLPYLISPKQQTQSHTCHAYSRARPHNAPAS